MSHLTKTHKTKGRKLQLACFWTSCINKTLLDFFCSRASRVLGPIGRYLVADILLHMKLVSRASRPGLLVGFLRILCNGLCTAQRFHTEEHDHTRRIGCPNEPDSLSHYNECPRLYYIFVSFWRHATILPQRNHFLHDLITRVFMRSLQYGIVVVGFLDASVCAHHKHRSDCENSGNFGDCTKGRIRLMTAITSAYAHAYQATCFTATHAWQSHIKTSAYESSKPDIRIFPMFVPQHVKEAMITVDGLFIQMVVLALLTVKLLLDGV